jgi:hypothetical protein
MVRRREIGKEWMEAGRECWGKISREPMFHIIPKCTLLKGMLQRHKNIRLGLQSHPSRDVEV